DLIVGALFVAHTHHANGSSMDVTTRERGLLDQNQDVQGISIRRIRVEDEAVVCRVVDCRIQHSVEPNDAGRLVQLVLVATTSRYFDDCFDHHIGCHALSYNRGTRRRWHIELNDACSGPRLWRSEIEPETGHCSLLA